MKKCAENGVGDNMRNDKERDRKMKIEKMLLRKIKAIFFKDEKIKVIKSIE